jgi:DNA-binding MarR family transcriptional regulator
MIDRTARGMNRALQRLRDIHPEMTVLQAQMLCVIAAHEGATQREVYGYLDANDSTASRILAILSDVGGRSVPPMNLVKMHPNPQDRRERLLTLTAKGKRLFNLIAHDLRTEENANVSI